MQALLPKIAAWVLSLVLSLLIIASHKHYTVDVTIAWYTVPLVFLALERRYSTKRKEGDDLPTRSLSVRRPDAQAWRPPCHSAVSFGLPVFLP